MPFVQLSLAALAVVGVCYLALAVALGFREKRHGSCTGSSVKDKGGGCGCGRK